MRWIRELSGWPDHAARHKGEAAEKVVATSVWPIDGEQYLVCTHGRSERKTAQYRNRVRVEVLEDVPDLVLVRCRVQTHLHLGGLMDVARARVREPDGVLRIVDARGCREDEESLQPKRVVTLQSCSQIVGSMLLRSRTRVCCLNDSIALKLVAPFAESMRSTPPDSAVFGIVPRTA